VSAVPETPAPRGFVIVGAPRSGTTLLRRLLDAHPSIACPPETYVLSAAARFLHEDTFASGLHIGVTSGLAFAGFEEAEVLHRLRELALGFLDDHARSHDKPIWAHKTAFDAFHLPAIRRLLDGHVRWICVHRHGLDVAASIAELAERSGGYVDELHAYVRRNPRPLEAFCEAWVDISAQLEALSQRDDALTIRYEDLTGNPDETFGRVLDFVGEPLPGETSFEEHAHRALIDTSGLGFGDWKTYGRSAIDASSVGRWKSLPREQTQAMAEICNSTLERLGYDTIPTGRTPNAEGARRRYEMGLLVNRMRAEKSNESEPPGEPDAT
jgi:hypothetical protein